MLKGEHCAIISTFIKLPVVIKIFDLSIVQKGGDRMDFERVQCHNATRNLKMV